jgi:large subunit ribosomal protein L32
MAVPKKRTSSSKKKSRRATWINKAEQQAKRAISLAKSCLLTREGSTSFLYNAKSLSNKNN